MADFVVTTVSTVIYMWQNSSEKKCRWKASTVDTAKATKK